MKKILSIIFIPSFILSVCGDVNADVANIKTAVDLTKQCKDSLNCTLEEKVYILKLPEDPDVKLNNSTLLGIDSDSSKKMIRDDIERKIGIRFFENSQARNIYNRQAELWSLILINKDESKLLDYIDEYMKNIKCKINGFVKDFDGKSLEYFHSNTPERYLEFYSIVHDSSYKYHYIEDSIVKAYCESFK